MARSQLNYSARIKRACTHWVLNGLHDNDMPQRELASTLGITQQALSKKIKNGNFKLGELIEIANTFNNLDELEKVFTS